MNSKQKQIKNLKRQLSRSKNALKDLKPDTYLYQLTKSNIDQIEHDLQALTA